MEETNSIHTSLYKTDEMSFFSSFNIKEMFHVIIFMQSFSQETIN